MTATLQLILTPMPYLTLNQKYRATIEMDRAELRRLLEESRKSEHECPTMRSMQSVRP